LEFYKYIKNNNESHAKVQLEYLQMIVEYMEDGSLLPPANQETVRESCLKLWDIPKVNVTERSDNRSGGRGTVGRGRGRGGRGTQHYNTFPKGESKSSKKEQSEADTVNKFKQLFGEG